MRLTVLHNCTQSVLILNDYKSIRLMGRKLYCSLLEKSDHFTYLQTKLSTSFKTAIKTLRPYISHNGMLEHWPEFLIILAREGYLYVIVLYFSPKGIETLFQAVRNSGVMCVSDGQALGRTQTYLWEAAFFGANSYSSGYQRLHTAKMELSKETVSNTLNNYVLQVV